jgi:hypothetical protein
VQPAQEKTYLAHGFEVHNWVNPVLSPCNGVKEWHRECGWIKLLTS